MNVTCGDTVRLTNGPFLELFHLLLTSSELIVVSIMSERTVLKTLSVLIQIHQLACESCFSLKNTGGLLDGFPPQTVTLREPDE